jgi:hypothetical protein
LRRVLYGLRRNLGDYASIPARQQGFFCTKLELLRTNIVQMPKSIT